jgi:competence protein ComFC
MLQPLVELVFPSVCAGCGAPGAGVLCPSCRPARVHRPRMPVHGVAHLFASAGYGTGTANALRAAKYHRRREVMVRLASDLARALAPALKDGGITAIVPVPTPWRRRVTRGFSAPHLLADALSRELGVPIADVLSAQDGARQAGLDKPSRRAAVLGRYQGRGKLKGRVLLVDDVVTTGATAEACAERLRALGATEVALAVLCAVR